VRRCNLSPELSFRFDSRSSHSGFVHGREFRSRSGSRGGDYCFTGDIGRGARSNPSHPEKWFTPGPPRVKLADLVCDDESTYGNRTHPKEDPLPELARLIKTTAERGGSIVVPAFAIERHAEVSLHPQAP